MLNRIASGGPEIVVTEYSTPSPMPKGTPNRRSDRIGLPPAGGLDQNEGQNDRVGEKFGPVGMKRRQKISSDGDAGQQPDENGEVPFAIRPQHCRD